MPTLTGFNPSITFNENTVNATPQLLDANVVFTDVEGDFNGGTLTLSGLLAEDRVSVRNQGSGAGQIGLSGANVTFGGVTIGTLAGGSGATLTITFNASATSAAIDALIQNLTYANVSDTPTTSRDLRLNITDAAGNDLGASGSPSFTARTGAANPFNGVDVGFTSSPTFADLDGDGDLDAVVGEFDGNLNYFRNTGTATAPVFVQQTGAANPFDGVDVGLRSTPTFADLDGDGDGDLDAVVGEFYGSLSYFRNTGTATAPVFVQQTGAANPFNGVDVGDLSTPTFADLDGDGDLDAVVGEDLGNLNYFRNTGTATAPVFAQQTGAANPFNGVDVGEISTPTFADIDGDGDLDAVVGGYDGTLLYFRNTGTATAPVFAQQTGAANPFNGVDVGEISTPTFADIDGDGDLDAVVGENDGNLNHFENTTPLAGSSSFTARTGAANPFNGVDVGFNSTPTFADLDGDGDLDAVVGEFDGNLNYFRNTGTATAPVFVQQTGAANPFNGVDVGRLITPTFADIDGDGDLDAVVGEGGGTLLYFRNTGTARAPVFAQQTGAANPFNGVNVGLYSKPTFADLDGDGDLDAVVGESDGNLNYFRNTGTATAPVFVQQTGAANPFNGVDVGRLSAPVFTDLDGDGDLDVVVGENDGALVYFRNSGTATTPVFAQQTGAANPFNGLDVGFESTPTFADVDGDGDLDAVVGTATGFLNFFENTTPRGQTITVTVNAEIDGPTEGDDSLTGDGSDNVIDGLGGNDTINGLGGNDILIGGAGNDTLNGGLGVDTMAGGLGDDLYFVNTIDDVLQEFAGQGRDIVYTSVTFRLREADDIELLVADPRVGTSALNLAGNGIANLIFGNDGANILEGGGGDDALFGYLGNDTLNGGLGVDTMAGGLGDDIYFIDTIDDILQEFSGEGRDIVYTNVSFRLRETDDIELLVADPRGGTSALNLAGNGIANLIFGNDGANILEGGGGNDALFGYLGNDTLNGGLGVDTMAGGLGDDIYFIDTIDDVLQEFSGEGRDIVYTTVNFRLRETDDIELLVADPRGGTSALNLAGNGIANLIFGNDGANILEGGGGDDALFGYLGNDTLNGGLGVDTMAGGLGDDIYFIDTIDDVLQEFSGEGRDFVYTTVSYRLRAADDIEVLLADPRASTAAINLTGNDLVNSLFGNAGANILDGKGGNDVLTGNEGADSYGFSTALNGVSNVDTILGFSIAEDRVLLGAAGGQPFASLTAGTLAASAFATGSAATTAAHRIVYDATNGNLFFDADGSGAGTAIQFANIGAGLALTASHFTVTGTLAGAPEPTSKDSAADPQVLPGVADDGFVMLAKDSDTPLVLPGADGFDDLADPDALFPPMPLNQMLTVGYNGELISGSGGLDGRHDHDGWLF